MSQSRMSVLLVAAANVTRAMSLAASMFVLARALGTTGRGEVAAALAPMTAATAVFAGGLPDAVAHFVAKFPRSARTTLMRSLWVALLMGVLGAGAVLALARPLAGGHHSLSTLIGLTGLATVPSIAVAVLRSFASGRQMWRRVSLEALIAGCCQVAGLLILWLTHHLGAPSALAVMAASIAVGGIAYVGTGRPRDGSPRGMDEVPLTMLANFSAGAWLGAVGMVGLTYLDQMLMTPLASVEQLGIYALAINIASLLSVVTVSIRSVVLVNESTRIDFDRLARHARLSLLVSLCLAAMAASVLPIMVPLVFGRAFAGSVVPALILLPPLVVTASGSVATAGLMALGRPWLRSVAIAVGMVVNVALLLMLLPPFGATGAALAMLASALPPLMSIWFLKIYHGQRPRDYLLPRLSDVRRLVVLIGRLRPHGGPPTLEPS